MATIPLPLQPSLEYLSINLMRLHLVTSLSSSPYHRLVVLSIINRPANFRAQTPHKPRCHCPAALVTTSVVSGLVEPS